MDARGLSSDSYRVEIADSQGDSIWQSSLPAAGDTLTVSVERSLSAGNYWIRIYESRAGGKLLREFALTIE
jgi:hypothetical protein